MKNYTLEVKIAEKGTLYKGTETSTFGHMYYVLVDQYGNRKSFGWGRGKSSILGGAENIRKSDDKDYTETKDGKIHTIKFNITEKQYNVLINHGNKPFHRNLFDYNYDLLNNSCIDYVFVGLHKAGINPYRYEGKLTPSANIDVINEFKKGNFRVPLTPYGIYLKQLEILDQVNKAKELNKGQITNKFSLISSSEITKEKNQDFDYFSATRGLSLGFNKDALNKSTKTSDLALSSIITDDTRIANHNLVALKAVEIANYVISNLPGTNHHTNHVKLNQAQGKPFKIAIDPLILDLNGDGARAVSYIEKPVLFDIDNDGGSLEETGWLNNQDGLLVRDLNNNGKIDNISAVRKLMRV